MSRSCALRPVLVEEMSRSLIQQLIEGTSYSPLQQEIEAIDEDVTLEGWNNIRNAIHSITNNISSKYDLPLIFKLIRDLGKVNQLRGNSKSLRRKQPGFPTETM